MKKNLFLRLCLMMAVILSLYSCHNEDFANQEANSKRNAVDFFKHSKNGGLNAKSGVDYIAILEAYNEEHNFLATMPDQEGMPIWDKMQVVDTEETTGLMIPLSHDDETMSSILFATLDGENLVKGVKDYDNILLKDIVYDQRISKENRENLFLTFMQMDNRTFGNEHFIGIPKDLFVGKKSDDEYGIIWVRNFAPPSSVNVQQNGKLMIIETCFIALHCTHHGPGICDAEEGCTECGTTFCSYEVIGTADDPFPSTPGGGGCSGCGGGGGGTSPGPNVPTNPCGLNVGNVFYRLAPGCGGGSGLPILDDPCEKTKLMLENPEVQEKLDSLKKESLTTHEIAFKIKKDGTTSAIIDGGEHEVSMGDMTGWQGGYHNHTVRGIPMHSPPDIGDVLLAFARAQPTGEHNNAFFGMIVKKPCSTCTGGFKTYHYVIRFNGTYADALTNFSQDKLNQLKNDYRKREKDLAETLPYVDFLGAVDLNNKGVEKLFFDTLTNMNIPINKIILQRVDDDGIINNITLDENGIPKATPCP